MRKQNAIDRESSLKRPFNVVTLLAFFVFHAVVALTLNAHEAPDEWWQSAEVAYFLVFGKGKLTWEWDVGIRSVFFPLFYAIPFYILRTLHLDTALTVFMAEKITQALILTCIDGCTLAIAHQLDLAVASSGGDDSNKDSGMGGSGSGGRTGNVANAGSTGGTTKKFGKRLPEFLPSSVSGVCKVLLFFSFYYNYIGVRSYSNVAETLFILLAILQREYWSFLCFSGLACMVRPTAAIAIIPFVFGHLSRIFKRHGMSKGFCYFVSVTAILVVIILGVNTALDYCVYGRVVLSPIKFLYVNVVQNVSELYGTHSFVFFFVCLPAIIGPHVFFALFLSSCLMRTNANWRTRKFVNLLFADIVWVILAFSLLSHKEMRFIFCIIPLSLVVLSYILSCFVRSAATMQWNLFRNFVLDARIILLLHKVFLVINIFLFALLSFHQADGNLVMRRIRNGPHYYENLAIMTNCYDTPGYAQMHTKVGKLTVVDCNLAFDEEGKVIPKTERDYFVQDPVRYIQWLYEGEHAAFLQPPVLSNETGTQQQQWLAGLKAVLREEAPLPLPEGLILYEDVAEALVDSFLAPKGFFREFRAFHVFGGPKLELWRRVEQRGEKVTE